VTALRRLLIRVLERLLGRYYEGPEPPARAGEVVLEFCRLYPRATRQQWIDFVVEHSRLMWREGYVRGFEWAERDPDLEGAREPEELMRVIDPTGGWLERPMSPDESLPLDDPPGEGDDADVAEEIALERDRQREYAARKAAGPILP
jgi:hypothetical protein